MTEPNVKVTEKSLGLSVGPHPDSPECWTVFDAEGHYYLRLATEGSAKGSMREQVRHAENKRLVALYGRCPRRGCRRPCDKGGELCGPHARGLAVRQSAAQKREQESERRATAHRNASQRVEAAVAALGGEAQVTVTLLALDAVSLSAVSMTLATLERLAARVSGTVTA